MTTTKGLLKRSLVTHSEAVQYSKKMRRKSLQIALIRCLKRDAKLCKPLKQISVLRLKSLSTKINACVLSLSRLHSHTQGSKVYSRLSRPSQIQYSLSRRPNLLRDSLGSFSALSRISIYWDNICWNNIRTVLYPHSLNSKEIRTTKMRKFWESSVNSLSDSLKVSFRLSVFVSVSSCTDLSPMFYR